MKILKKSKEFINDVVEKFAEYLQNLKDGDRIKFEYEPSAHTTIKPIVKFTPEAYMQMRTLINRSSGEIGWNGVVTRDGDDFLIYDILVYPQTVTGATVTCDEIETGLWLSKFDNDTFKKIRFQGHSHVNMSATPSAVDRTMYDKYVDTIGDDDFYIFMIMNKKEEFYIELIDKKNNAIFYKNDIKVEILGEEYFWSSVQENIKTVKPPVVQQQVIKTSEDNIKVVYNGSFENCKDDCSKCNKQQECLEYYLNKEII